MRNKLHLLYILLVVLMIAGSLNWGVIGLTGVNPLEKIFPSLIVKMVYILVGLSAVLLITRRDYYLPFLGRTVLPCPALPLSFPEGADKEVVVDVKPDAKVIYWASKLGENQTENSVAENPWLAYGDMTNTGVTFADKDGKATLRVKAPVQYKVGLGKVLKQHIHYRVCEGDGMLSRVHTVFL